MSIEAQIVDQRVRKLAEDYREVFADTLAPAQLVIAVQLHRGAEAFCKRFHESNKLVRFLPYASHFIAMRAGALLLEKTVGDLSKLNHITLSIVSDYLDQNEPQLFPVAAYELILAFLCIGINIETASLQQLSGSFRRGDLVAALEDIDTHWLNHPTLQENKELLERVVEARKKLPTSKLSQQITDRS